MNLSHDHPDRFFYSMLQEDYGETFKPSSKTSSKPSSKPIPQKKTSRGSISIQKDRKERKDRSKPRSKPRGKNEKPQKEKPKKEKPQKEKTSKGIKRNLGATTTKNGRRRVRMMRILMRKTTWVLVLVRVLSRVRVGL